VALKATGTLVERVAAELRGDILDGRLEPGARIGQVALARRFGTSRVPVREALRLLQSEGLVSVVPNAGARVAGLSLAELTEVYLLRERLEPLAIAESVPNLTQGDVAGLGERVEAMEAAAKRGDRWDWLAIDRDFHLSAFAGAPTPRLLALVGSFWNVATRYRRAYTAVLFPAELEVQHHEHRLILDAIERRNVRDAAAFLEIHIRRTRLGLNQHAELFGDDGGNKPATRAEAAA
jgi:DNA-binding GntR family transcriptional regulator